ncbi:MAG TPA: GDSL-type esterase/lipase family protein [Xanthobacteraceae bacterium]|nr:GDSL-type esterase/lipase family protein [Xanthobacteraceae bacterium]
MTRVIFLILIGILAMPRVAFAAPEPACQVAAHVVRADFPLPRVAKAIADKKLDIDVLGSASSALMDSGGKQRGYPVQLEAVLSAKLPGVKVKVTTYSRPRETAGQMEKGFAPVLANDKPALTIWQTGTVEAMRRIDLDDFRAALDEGIEHIQAANSDVILMNPQYSPRTELMMGAPQYAEAMRFVALQHEVPLFDRFSIMRHWGELGIFDLNEATKKIDTAAKVHDCIGSLLAVLILDAANLQTASKPDNH